MEDYIKRMNEEYIKKNYPERSVFKAYKKSMGSRGRTGCIIMGLFMAGGLAGLIWSVRKTLEFMQSGDDETMKVGIVIGIFFLIVTLFFGGILFLVTKDMRRSMEEWISRIAAAGGCSEGEMREFDNQAVEPDSLIVNLLDKGSNGRSEKRHTYQGLYCALQQRQPWRIKSQPDHRCVLNGQCL